MYERDKPYTSTRREMENDLPLLGTLVRAQFISFTTYRTSGEAVATPVWFSIISKPDTISIETGAQTGKVKRIRKTARVTLASCTVLGRIAGETFEARAHVVSDEDELQKAEEALARRYGWRRKLASSFSAVMHKLLGQPASQTVYLAVELWGER